MPGVVLWIPRLQCLVDGRNIFVRGGETVLEGESIEEHQASNTECGGTVLLLVGAGNDVGDAAGYPGMFCDFFRRLFQRVPNRACGSGHSVHALQLQWKGAQLVGKLCDRPAPYRAWLRRRHAARAMQPPLKVRSSFKASIRILFISKAVGVENANHSKSFGKVFQAFLELTIQAISGAVPFAFQNHQVSASQFDADIGGASPAAALRPSRHAVVAEGLGEKDIDAFFASSLWIVLSSRHCLYRLSQRVAARIPRPVISTDLWSQQACSSLHPMRSRPP